jgi:T5SS/PEP-CTERM-associated repeat protein
VDAIYVGDGGNGQLVLSGGGSASSGGGTIGNQAGSVGAVTIEAKSTWSNTLWFDVGYEGSGTLKITAGGSMSVGKDLDLANSAAVEAGSVHGGKGQVVVDGAGANFDVNGQIDLGVDGSGGLVVEARGKVVSGDASGKTASGVVLGYYSDGAGSLDVTGAGSSLVNTGLFEVAAGGDGRMTVAAGAKVTTNVKQSLGYDALYIGGGSDSVGTIAVSGKGSAFDVGADAVIGEGGTAALDVSSAGAVSIGASLASASDVAVDIGLDKGSKGTLAVAGSNSTLEVTGQVYLGVSGAGVLDVESEGFFRAKGNTTIGDDQGAVGSLVVTGSLTNDGKSTRSEFQYGSQLDVGASGVGSLSVEAGALVTFLSGGSSAGDIDVGAVADGHGKVTISGAGSLLRGVRLILGGATGATASVAISDGGALTVTGDASIDAGATVTLAGGDLNAVEATFAKTGALKGFGLVGAGTIDGGALTASGGVLQLKGLVEDATLRVSSNSTMQLDGGAAKTTILDFTGTVGEQFSFLKPQSIGATIDNFLKGDTLDLGNVTVKTDTVQLLGASETTLTLSLSDGDVAKLTFAGAYTKNDFVFTAQSGSTIISHS